jgi:hypothetical protein
MPQMTEMLVNIQTATAAYPSAVCKSVFSAQSTITVIVYTRNNDTFHSIRRTVTALSNDNITVLATQVTH